jgi:hypothetical protein
MSAGLGFNFDHLFTADPTIIENQIMSSKYKTEIITTVIVEINLHVDDEDFINYVCDVNEDEYRMYIKYLNTFYKDKKIDKILNKKKIYADDMMTIDDWVLVLHNAYTYFRSHKLATSYPIEN